LGGQRTWLGCTASCCPGRLGCVAGLTVVSGSAVYFTGDRYYRYTFFHILRHPLGENWDFSKNSSISSRTAFQLGLVPLLNKYEASADNGDSSATLRCWCRVDLCDLAQSSDDHGHHPGSLPT
jgi:hypothetical protein